MSVLLRASRDLPKNGSYERWLLIGAGKSDLDPGRALADVADRLERSYGTALDDWRTIAPVLARDPGAEYAHTPTCAPNASDFGEMLAWTKLVDEIADAAERVLVVCDDPWIFRHLACRPNVTAGSPPALLLRTARLALRGYLARMRVALRSIAATVRLRRHREWFPNGATAILVYGHPASDADGRDGYFGDLMASLPSLMRVLHVDCAPSRAVVLARDGRTVSLHAWGCLRRAGLLTFAKWRPAARHRRGPYGWLVRRAAALEGATGQAAMIRWQRICQARWITAMRPRCVAWPWENHAWERAFVRLCNTADIRTVGYQHATIGRYEMNYAYACNSDGLDSIPETLVSSGPAGQAALLGFGYPRARLIIGGALRYAFAGQAHYDANAPIFVALPSDLRIAREMVDAVRTLARAGKKFLVRAHPMTPFHFAEDGQLRRAPGRLAESGPLSAVIYAGTTVGLEAYLMGLPTFRFKPSSAVANDIIPDGISIVAVSRAALSSALAASPPPAPVDPKTVFAVPNYALWATLLDGAAAA